MMLLGNVTSETLLGHVLISSYEQVGNKILPSECPVKESGTCSQELHRNALIFSSTSLIRTTSLNQDAILDT